MAIAWAISISLYIFDIKSNHFSRRHHVNDHHFVMAKTLNCMKSRYTIYNLMMMSDENLGGRYERSQYGTAWFTGSINTNNYLIKIHLFHQIIDEIDECF